MPDLTWGRPVAVSVIIMSIWPPSRSVTASGLLLYVQQLHIGHLLQQLAGDAAAGAAATEAELAGRLARLRDKVADALGRRIRIDHHDLAALAQQRQRRIVLDGPVGQRLVQMLVGGVRGVGGDEHGIAVGRGARGGRADHGAGAGLVLDHHGLAGLLRDALADGAPDLVGGAAGREGHDEGDGLGGEGLGRGGQRQAAASSKASRFRRGVRIVCLLCSCRVDQAAAGRSPGMSGRRAASAGLTCTVMSSNRKDRLLP